MANKPNVENRWWVETTVKRPRKPEQTRPDPGAAGQGTPEEAGSEESPAQLDVAAGFYTVARDYNQDRAKEDLTDNNLRIARAANPQPGQWVYVAMTKEHYPERLIKRIKDEFISEPYPAWTAIGVTELITEGTLVEIRAIAKTS